jgi:CBS domain-containing protein
MTGNPACCTPDSTAADAARLMEKYDCGCIPVVQSDDDHSVVGVITDRDIAIRCVSRGLGSDATVSELMTSAPHCCGPDADLQEVEQLMSDRQVRRIVVVDDGGECLGIVAQADLARAADRSSEVSDAEIGRVVERISEPNRRNWRL